MNQTDSLSLTQATLTPPPQGESGGEWIWGKPYWDDWTWEKPYWQETALSPLNDYGMAGDPVPYTVSGDSLVTLMLLVCFVMAVVSAASTRGFLSRQLKLLFRPHVVDTDISETSGEVRFQLFLIFVRCLLMAIVANHYVGYYQGATLVIDGELLALGIFFAVFVGYQLIYWSAYALVDHVFFTPQQNSQWLKIQLFLNASMGVTLFPAVMIMAYYNLSFEKVVYYYGFVFIFTKTIAFYKSWNIFFRQNGIYLQNFLYFCALEIIPLLSLGAGLMVLIDHLKLNY
ncbi:MAG: DUF4271 domain-containing protein [Prevotella sp.]|nr:DUF4271 domain-containing protein [Prevotella sp.]